MAKRPIEPLLWLLFSAGGVLAALLLPVLLLLFGVAFPLGWLAARRTPAAGGGQRMAEQVKEAPAGQQRPDYGLDAPGVVRNLLLAGAAGLAVWGGAALGLWPGAAFGVVFTPMALGMGVSFTL